MRARHIMVQGTGSHVGKSVLTAALCRYFHEQGLRVAPFKAQNMSNNSFVTRDGGEIGRAQAFQAREYHAYQPHLLGIIRESLETLSNQYDIVIIEGAGSPAEINLPKFDIVNMAVAKMVGAPVILVGDINFGGVFAWLVGALELLEPEERALVKGFVINMFRGDISLLDDGIQWLEAKTGKKVLGVLPFVKNLQVQEEDTIPESKQKRSKHNSPDNLEIAILHLPHISNSTDFEALELEPDVSLRYLGTVPPRAEKSPDLLIIPGSRNTIDDLEYLRSCGLAQYVLRCHEGGVPVMGICGGYQMLGESYWTRIASSRGLAEPRDSSF